MPSRAYTFKIKPFPHDRSAATLALWQTHHLVNVGAAEWGDWLLTFRGALSPDIAETEPDPLKRETIQRFLALSWLSVESKMGAPAYVVAEGSDYTTPDDKKKAQQKVLAAFREILSDFGVTNHDEWVRVCTPSLSAAIRDDAVWVNRAKCFKERVAKWPSPPTEADIWDFLTPFLGDPKTFFAVTGLPTHRDQGATKDANTDGENESTQAPNRKQSPKNFAHKAGAWLSQRFGEGKGANFASLATTYQSIHTWAIHTIQTWEETGQTDTSSDGILTQLGQHLDAPATVDGILKTISGPGYKSATRNVITSTQNAPTVSMAWLHKLREVSETDGKKCAENAGNKTKKDYANQLLASVEAATGLKYHPLANERAYHAEHSVILDHAARRVSMAHTNMKKREVERQGFDDEHQIPPEVVSFLDAYVDQRTAESGALESYHIRKRALIGWHEVCKAWRTCHTEDERLKALRHLQAHAEEKWGDHRLFEDMATQEAQVVTQDPDHLKWYQHKQKADYDKKRFKIPMYRHPHTLQHPVFCDFGDSRFEILFDFQKPSVFDKRLKKATRHRPPTADGVPIDQLTSDSVRGSLVEMTVWNGTTTQPTVFRWQSKRLQADITCHDPHGPGITRANRLGRITAGVSPDEPVSLLGPGVNKAWGTRLQVPRTQLTDLYTCIQKELSHDPSNHEVNQYVLQHEQDVLFRMNWMGSATIELTPNGHGTPYFETIPKFMGPRGSQGQYARHPGIRVMGVDLGHRHAAACAIWEACTIESVHAICQAHDHALPQETDAFCHVRYNTPQGKKNIVFRRIGPDRLPDQSPHPAPWARLDRQFLVKLPGEDEVRALWPHEQAVLHHLDRALGLEYGFRDRLFNKRPGLQKTAPSWQPNQQAPTVWADLDVDKAMQHMVAIVTKAIKRHAELATIAHDLTLKTKTLSGGKKEAVTTDDERLKILEQACLRLCKLIQPDKEQTVQWQTADITNLWRDTLPHMSLSGNQCHEAANHLLKDQAKRAQLRNAIIALWDKQDPIIQQVIGVVGRWLRKGRLEHPDVTTTVTFKPSDRQKVGGLSLSRIATLTEFRQKVQVGFASRPNPHQDAPVCGDMKRFGNKLLQSLERLRDQRIKQLCSRLLEGALGAGRLSSPIAKRPQESLDSPCHAIVIENLDHYKPDELRTRRENRRLMAWSAAKIKEVLKDGAALYDIKVWEESAAYTSRQDSRTGAPGLRCDDIPVTQFLGPKWEKEYEHIDWLCELKKGWQSKPEKDQKAGVVRLPKRGGALFVSAHQGGPMGLQADLNAAANIALKSLMDMTYTGRWWKVPCKNPKSHSKDKATPTQDKGMADFQSVKPDKKVRDSGLFEGCDGLRARGVSGTSEVINVWRDIGHQPLHEGEWQGYAAYHQNVTERVMARLEPHNQTRLGIVTDPLVSTGQ